MTIEDLKKAVPKHARSYITERFVDELNHIGTEYGQEYAEHYKQNYISMSSVLQGGSYTSEDYISAVKFVAFQLLGHNGIDSYMMTFPDRYERLMDKWTAEGLNEERIRGQKISPFVTAYKQNDIVIKIMEQSLIPSHIMNAPNFQEALNIQMDIARNGSNEVARTSAANSVLAHTKQPEVSKVQMDVAITGSDDLAALRNTMADLASNEIKAIERGQNTALEIAEKELIYDVECDD